MPCGRVFDNSSGLWLSLVSPLQERNKLQIKYKHNIVCFFKKFNSTDQSVLLGIWQPFGSKKILIWGNDLSKYRRYNRSTPTVWLTAHLTSCERVCPPSSLQQPMSDQVAKGEIYQFHHIIKNQSLLGWWKTLSRLWWWFEDKHMNG